MLIGHGHVGDKKGKTRCRLCLPAEPERFGFRRLIREQNNPDYEAQVSMIFSRFRPKAEEQRTFIGTSGGMSGRTTRKSAGIG